MKSKNKRTLTAIDFIAPTEDNQIISLESVMSTDQQKALRALRVFML